MLSVEHTPFWFALVLHQALCTSGKFCIYSSTLCTKFPEWKPKVSVSVSFAFPQIFCICLFSKMACRLCIQWGDFYKVEKRRRGVEALLFVLSVFCWQQCKPLVWLQLPTQGAGSCPAPLLLLSLAGKIATRNLVQFLAQRSSCLCGIQLFPLLPPFHIVGFCFRFFCCFFSTFVSNWETCHILSGWKGDLLKIFASCLVDGKTS